MTNTTSRLCNGEILVCSPFLGGILVIGSRSLEISRGIDEVPCSEKVFP